MDKLEPAVKAGIAGLMASFIWNIPMHYLGFSKLRYMDFAAALTFGHFPTNAAESAFAFIVTIFWFIFLSVVFSRFAGQSHLLAKGFFYGGMVWTGSYWISLLFKVPPVLKIDVNTACSNFIGGLLYGLTMSYVLKRLLQKQFQDV